VRAKYALPALAAAVVKNGEVIARSAVGVRALGTDVAVTDDDRFHLGSDIKAMTATLVGMMVDEGKLRWTSTIGEVLGAKVSGMNPALAAVTLEQLLSHTGGIPTDNEDRALGRRLLSVPLCPSAKKFLRRRAKFIRGALEEPCLDSTPARLDPVWRNVGPRSRVPAHG
jgi:CubicO group peptidase (beta-lactamase class C family)